MMFTNLKRLSKVLIPAAALNLFAARPAASQNLDVIVRGLFQSGTLSQNMPPRLANQSAVEEKKPALPRYALEVKLIWPSTQIEGLFSGSLDKTYPNRVAYTRSLVDGAINSPHVPAPDSNLIGFKVQRILHDLRSGHIFIDAVVNTEISNRPLFDPPEIARLRSRYPYTTTCRGISFVNLIPECEGVISDPTNRTTANLGVGYRNRFFSDDGTNFSIVGGVAYAKYLSSSLRDFGAHFASDNSGIRTTVTDMIRRQDILEATADPYVRGGVDIHSKRIIFNASAGFEIPIERVVQINYSVYGVDALNQRGNQTGSAGLDFARGVIFDGSADFTYLIGNFGIVLGAHGRVEPYETTTTATKAAASLAGNPSHLAPTYLQINIGLVFQHRH